MNQVAQTPSFNDDRIDLLDLLAVVAESWKIIIIGTSLVAIATAVILVLMPPVYESFFSTPISPRVRASLSSPNILDPVINANNLGASFGGDIESARDSLRRKIKVEELAKDIGYYRIGVQGDTPARAKALAVSYLGQILLESKPTGSLAQTIHDQITLAQDTITELQKLSEPALPGSNNVLIVASGAGKTEDDRFPRLLSIPIEIARRKAEILSLEHQLDGYRVEDVLQQPTLPARPVARHRLSSFIGITGVGFVALIFFAYARDAIRKLNNDPERARKVRRILDALGWRREIKVESA